MDILLSEADGIELLKLIRQFAADESLRSIKNWLQIREKNLELIERSEKSIKAIRPFYDNIERYPIFDINTITRETNISYLS